MVDTYRTPSEMLALLADNNTGNITPQVLRDMYVSLSGITGWSDHSDGAHDTGSPQAITAGVDNIITNNGAVTRLKEVPLDRPDNLYDPINNNIVGSPGDALIFMAEYTVRRASGSGTFTFKQSIDILLGNDLYTSTRTLAGTGEQTVLYHPPVYTLDTWASNGGKHLITEASVDLEVFDKRFVIYRIHKGRGTYP